jgi:O-antigen/teichoic acid export membrane protein
VLWAGQFPIAIPLNGAAQSEVHYTSMSAISNALRSARQSNSIARVAATLVSGSIGSQMILLIASPLLTRLFTAEQFAVLNVYTSAISILSAFVVLRFDVAIFLVPKSSVASFAAFTSALAFILSCACGLACFLLSLIVTLDLLDISPSLFSLLLAVGLITSSVFSVMSNAALIYGAHNTNAMVRVVQSAAGVAIQIFAGLMAWGTKGLIAGYIVSQSLGITQLWRVIRNDRASSNPIPRFALLWKRYVRYKFRDFVVFSASASIVNRLSANMVVVLFALVYDLKSAGLLALAYRAANTPLLAVARGIAQLFQREFAKRRGVDRNKIVVKFIVLMLLAGAVPSIALVALGPLLFKVVFGAQWIDAGLYAGILAPAFLMQFIAYPLTQSFSLNKNGKWQLIWDTGRVVVIGLTFLLLNLAQVSPFFGVSCISALLVAIYGGQVLMSVLLARRQ